MEVCWKVESEKFLEQNFWLRQKFIYSIHNCFPHIEFKYEETYPGPSKQIHSTFNYSVDISQLSKFQQPVAAKPQHSIGRDWEVLPGFKENTIRRQIMYKSLSMFYKILDDIAKCFLDWRGYGKSILTDKTWFDNLPIQQKENPRILSTLDKA